MNCNLLRIHVSWVCGGVDVEVLAMYSQSDDSLGSVLFLFNQK